ncbi:Hypothetical_protein [Hexamita inflata]|uniref:Hypothetical_protein n=1 Tax=Hexamita inflata TaxID=28002 RepID=A0AA86U3S5_9EUKA|nr:Hypothetical protein HINF_LOCUS27179 [Hexamita inflata]
MKKSLNASLIQHVLKINMHDPLAQSFSTKYLTILAIWYPTRNQIISTLLKKFVRPVFYWPTHFLPDVLYRVTGLTQIPYTNTLGSQQYDPKLWAILVIFIVLLFAY